MSERNGLRYGLLGLALLILMALLALVINRPDSSPTPAPAAESTSIESLAALGDQPPSRRDLNIQTWQTAEGAKVLFVEARELPMFDLQLTFAAGSSHDDGTAGLVYERDSITSQATAIGQLETVGLSWKLIDQELAELEAVTPADIQQAASTFFTRDRLSVAHVLPEEKRNE